MATVEPSIMLFTNASGDYEEPQEQYLCAKHAINHVLQEEKVVWLPGQPELVLKPGSIGSTSYTSANTQINLFEACNIFPTYQAGKLSMTVNNYKQSGYNINEEGFPLPVNDDENPVLCNFSNGETPFQLVGKILNDLQYNVEEGYNITELSKRLSDEKLLGVVINRGAWHFTAISKFVKQCKSWERNTGAKRLTSVSYAYMESLNAKKGSPIIECMNKPTLLTFIKTIKPQGFYFVYGQPEAYKSVAVLRLEQLLRLKKADGYALTGGRSTKRIRRRKQRSTRRN